MYSFQVRTVLSQSCSTQNTILTISSLSNPLFKFTTHGSGTSLTLNTFSIAFTSPDINSYSKSPFYVYWPGSITLCNMKIYGTRSSVTLPYGLLSLCDNVPSFTCDNTRFINFTLSSSSQLLNFTGRSSDEYVVDKVSITNSKFKSITQTNSTYSSVFILTTKQRSITLSNLTFISFTVHLMEVHSHLRLVSLFTTAHSRIVHQTAMEEHSIGYPLPLLQALPSHLLHSVTTLLPKEEQMSALQDIPSPLLRLLLIPCLSHTHQRLLQLGIIMNHTTMADQIGLALEAQNVPPVKPFHLNRKRKIQI